MIYSYLRLSSSKYGLCRIFRILKDQMNVKAKLTQHFYKNIIYTKQVKTNIGLADTVIPFSFIYLIYMGGTRPCDSIKIIFGYHVNSLHIILNIKFGVNRMFHVLKIPVYRFDLYGRYRTLWTDDDNFGSVI